MSCSAAYSEPMMSDALGRLVGSRQMLLQPAHILVAILKVWHHIKNAT